MGDSVHRFVDRLSNSIMPLRLLWTLQQAQLVQHRHNLSSKLSHGALFEGGEVDGI